MVDYDSTGTSVLLRLERNMRREIWRETYGRKAPIRIARWLFWWSILVLSVIISLAIYLGVQ